MQLTVTGIEFDVGDVSRRHVADSLEGILGKYFGGAIDASAILSREPHRFEQGELTTERERVRAGVICVYRRTDGNFGSVDRGAERRN